MRSKPWTMKEGFLIGGGLVLIGLALELCVGPVVWKAFAWPVNMVVLAGFLAMIALTFLAGKSSAAKRLLREKAYIFEFIGTCQAAIPAMAYAVVLTIVMGLVRQETDGLGGTQTDGTWLNHMLAFWPFVLIYVYMAVILGVATLSRLLRTDFRNVSRQGFRDVAFLLNHFGLFMALVAATLGNADIQRVKMVAAVGQPEFRAMAPDGTIKEMPLTIELRRFVMDTYDNGMPKRFASKMHILTESGESIDTVVEVNRPYKAGGWEIYQYGYDQQMGADSNISILELVSDPWLPAVYAGIFMMLAGALAMLACTVVGSRRRNRLLLSLAAILAAVLVCVYLFMPLLRSETLMPALQSPWFTPHIMAYMFAYAVMGVATVMAIMPGKPPKLGGHRGLNNRQTFPCSDPQPPNLGGLHLGGLHLGGLESLDNLVCVGVAFITFGMLFGAFWAKEAWGDYWSWDPKETWAAITWLSYLVYVHYRLCRPQSVRPAMLMLVVAFLLLQMCWWGINFLPSAQENSVHTYNM